MSTKHQIDSDPNSPNHHQRYIISPELHPEESNNMSNYNFNTLSHSNCSFGSRNHSPSLSQQASKEKQQISFFKSQQKELNEEEDQVDLNNTSDDEIKPNNKKQKRKSLRVAKSQSDLPQLNTQKNQPHYKIVVKQTLEEDALDKIAQQGGLEDDSLPQQNLQTRSDSNQSSDQDLNTPVQKKWNKIRNVLKGIQLFSQLEVETISKPSDIAAHLSSSSKSISPNREQSPEKRNLPEQRQDDRNASELMRNLQQEAQQNAVREQLRLIDDFKYRKKFFEAIENGSQEDLAYIEEYLKNDPKRYLIVEESIDRRMNKPDTFGQTPLYCAAKNGNLEVIKMLTKHKANHKLLTYLSNDQSASDTSLNVASRWGHVNVVEYLLNTYDWEAKDLKAAQKSTTNKDIKKLLSKKQ